MIRELALWATGQAATNALSIFGIFCVILHGTKGYARISLRRSVVISMASFFALQTLTAATVWLDLYLHRFPMIETVFRLTSSQAGTVFVWYLVKNIRETVTSSRGDASTKEYENILAKARDEKLQDRRNLLVFASQEAVKQQSISMQRAVSE